MSGEPRAGEPTAGYPHHLAGDPAPPPVAVSDRVFDMALRAAVRERGPELSEELLAATPWRVAESLEELLTEVNAAAPGRSRASDGTIGNAAHAQLGDDSDHNPWLIYQGKGIVRARDITNDPALALPAVFERFRAAAAARKLPQVLNGGYLIINGRITAPDWSGWRAYTGSNPHVAHGHVSVSLNPVQFDSTASWGVIPPAAPGPSPKPGAGGWAGPDLTGSGVGLRGDEGNSGPRVQAWQHWLNVNYPAYSRLVEDGEWGPRTSAVNAEFGRRSQIPSADGKNIGPKLAGAYFRAGLFRSLSAARIRVLRHVQRGARR